MESVVTKNASTGWLYRGESLFIEDDITRISFFDARDHFDAGVSIIKTTEAVDPILAQAFLDQMWSGLLTRSEL